MIRRRAFATTLAIALLGIVLIAGVAFAGLLMREITHARLALLEAQFEQGVQSARLWSRLHPEEITPETPVRLPLDAILPAGVSGVAELRVDTSDPALIVVRCEIRITGASRSLARASAWPK
jgi:hypothetical protein